MSKKREIVYLYVTDDEFEWVDDMFVSIEALAKFLGTSRAKTFLLIRGKKAVDNHKIEKLEFDEKL